jgi:hypothetical protein
VSIPIFKNDSQRRDFEFQLTQEVVYAVERVGFKVVDSDKADIELLGTITDANKGFFGNDGFSNPRGGNDNLTVRVRLIDRRSGKVLIDNEKIDPTPTTLSSTAPFLIDVVQSRGTADAQVAKDMAQNIVTLLHTPW